MKRLAIGAGVLMAVLVAAVAIVLAVGIPVGPFMSRVTPEIETQTGLQIRFDGSAKLVVWPELYFVADDVRVAEKGVARDFLKIDRVKVSLSYESLRQRKAVITDVTMRRPALDMVENQQFRRPAPASSSSGSSDTVSTAALGRISIEDGSLIYRIPRERLETKVDGIQLTAQARPAGGAMRVVGQGRVDNELVNLTAEIGSGPGGSGQSVPADLTLNFGGRVVSANGRFTVDDRGLKADNLNGRSGSDRFNGSLAVDWSRSRPHVAAALGFDRLQWSMPSGPASSPARRQSAANDLWSDQPLFLTPLRLFDASIRIATNELAVQGVRVSAAQIEADLRGGVLTISLPPAELHGGRIQGRLVVDASVPAPTHAVQLNVTGVNALPLFTEAVSFTHLEGRIQTRISLTAAGASSRAIVETLGGSAEMFIEDGAVRGVDVPKMIRAVSRNILSGWQEQDTERDKTPFAVFGATFRIANGKAAAEDLRLVSSVVRVSGKGTIDLPTQTLDFRMEPRLVVAEASRSRAEPIDLGVPVVVRGPWGNPQIYPDVADILQNPEAAYSKLRELGTGLFGMFGASEPGGSGSASGQPGASGKGMNDLMQSMDKLFNAPKGSETPGQPSQQGGFGDLLKGIIKQ